MELMDEFRKYSKELLAHNPVPLDFVFMFYDINRGTYGWNKEKGAGVGMRYVVRDDCEYPVLEILLFNRVDDKTVKITESRALFLNPLVKIQIEGILKESEEAKNARDEIREIEDDGDSLPGYG